MKTSLKTLTCILFAILLLGAGATVYRLGPDDVLEEGFMTVGNASAVARGLVNSTNAIAGAVTYTQLTNGLAGIWLDGQYPNAILRDGSRAMTGAFNAGGLAITNLAAGSAALDAVNYLQFTNQAAANLTSGTLANARLDPSVTLLGALIDLGTESDLSGAGLTNLNASALASGTVSNARLDAGVTLLGQLIELGTESDLNGAGLTNLNLVASGGVTNITGSGDIHSVFSLGVATLSVSNSSALYNLTLNNGTALTNINLATGVTGVLSTNNLDSAQVVFIENPIFTAAITNLVAGANIGLTNNGHQWTIVSTASGGGSDPFAAFQNSNNVFTAVNTFTGPTVSQGTNYFSSTNFVFSPVFGGARLLLGTNAFIAAAGGNAIYTLVTRLGDGFVWDANANGSTLFSIDGTAHMRTLLRSNGSTDYDALHTTQAQFQWKDGLDQIMLRISQHLGLRFGRDGNSFSNFVYSSATLDFGIIEAFATSNLAFAVSGVRVGDGIAPSLPTNFSPIVWHMIVTSNGFVNVHGFNPTNGPVSTLTYPNNFGATVFTRKP